MLRIQYRLRIEEAEENSPIVERIACVIELLDAERLLARLDSERGAKGRNKYPNRVLWHCLIAFACLGVRTVTEGLRYLQLSKELRTICGINGKTKIPSKHALYRFEKRLMKHTALLEEIFANTVRALKEKLPRFGEHLATDSTKIHSLANGRKPSADPEASWKKYNKQFIDENGVLTTTAVKWFGYKLHLIVDAVYELPISAHIATAKENDATQFENVWEKAKCVLPDLCEIAKSNALDKGYDDITIYKMLWDDGVEPIIAIREMTEEENRLLLPENRLVCSDDRPLRFDGFETSRCALRYDLPKDCPRRSRTASFCEFADECDQKLIRVKVTSDNLRHLGPVPRDSKKFVRLYNERSSAERVTSRLKLNWGLDCVRRYGEGRTAVWAFLALICMNGFALSMVCADRLSDIRKTVYSVAA